MYAANYPRIPLKIVQHLLNFFFILLLPKNFPDPRLCILAGKRTNLRPAAAAGQPVLRQPARPRP